MRRLGACCPVPLLVLLLIFNTLFSARSDRDGKYPSEIFIPLVLGNSQRATGIAVSNLGGDPVSLRFSVYEPDGTAKWNPVTWDEDAGTNRQGSLQPSEQRALHVFEIFQIDPAAERLGWMRIESESADIRVLYQFISSDVDQLDGMNGIFSPRKKIVLPWVIQGSGAYYGNSADTKISVVNPGSVGSDVTLTLLDSNGTEVATTTQTITAKGMLFQSVRDLFPSVADPSGVISVESPSEILGCELITINGANSNAYIVSNALDVDGESERLFSAQVARVSGIGTDLRILNSGPSSSLVTLSLRGWDGESLADTQSIEIPANGYFEANLGEKFDLPEGTVGTLKVETKETGLTGSVLFGDPSQVYAAALPLQSEIQGNVVFPHLAYLNARGGNPGIYTGLALHAPGDKAVEGVIEILDKEGLPTASGEFTLQAGKRISRLVSELVELDEQAGGYVRIRTNGEPLVAQELFGDTFQQMLSAVPSFRDPGYDPLEIPTSEFIVVDQFGYLPNSEKIAVIRDPRTGFDSDKSFQPGNSYALVNAKTGRRVLTADPSAWGTGLEDPSSGDRAWWFDFTQITKKGQYYVLDLEHKVRSFVFTIAEDVYHEVLKQAVRTFFYQRAGFEKAEPFAAEGWTDGASHIGPFQDKNCRRYDAPDDVATEKDLHGGWYDAGDYNKYTNWTAEYVIQLLRAYDQIPAAFSDNFGIPESGNGIPDLIDEVKWGMDWLIRMQNADGSVLSIVGLAHDSPPSAATGQSLYGTASTSATLTTSAAFAYGAKIFFSLGNPELNSYASDLSTRAKSAWQWAEANPNVIFRNNDSGLGTGGLGAGQQETDNYGRLVKKLEAAVYLFERTGDSRYRDFFDGHYEEVHMMQWNFVFPFESVAQEMLLYYSQLPGSTLSVANDIRNVYRNAMVNGDHNFRKFYSETDPYLAYIKDYTWGSNGSKSRKAGLFLNLIHYGLDEELKEDSIRASQRYLHYLHGTNPLNMVFLSNMYDFGAENAVNEFYHSWFTDGSALWDRVGVSTYGPAPGFLTGGPNPSYDWDGCCPNGCGSSSNNSRCFSESISPPKNQPEQKSYKDFNTSWPLNSWSVTENSCGYQVAYIRLLAMFAQ